MDDQNDGDLIEHMVVSGGGHNILAMFGAVAYLKKKKFIDINSLKTYDGTSAGALLGFILLLNLEDEEIDNYLMNRPWEKMFNISPSMMFKAFQSKGLFNVGLMEQILEPLTKTADLNINITFAEFFERTGVEFTVYTTELNSLKNVIISYKTHPDMVLLMVFSAVVQSPHYSHQLLKIMNVSLTEVYLQIIPLTTFLNAIQILMKKKYLQLNYYTKLVKMTQF